MTVLAFFWNWLNFWRHVWIEIHEAFALVVVPGYKTGHLERDTLGVSAAKKLNGLNLLGLPMFVYESWLALEALLIVWDSCLEVHSCPLRHNHPETASFGGPLLFQNRTSLDAGGCQLFKMLFYFLALWLKKVFDDSSRGVSLMIDFIIWLFLLTPIGCRLYQTSPRRGKVDRLCKVREDDAKGTLWRLQRGTYHLQLQNIFGRKRRGFFRQSRLACFSRILDKFNILHVVFVQAETVMLKRRPCRQQTVQTVRTDNFFKCIIFIY